MKTRAVALSSSVVGAILVYWALRNKGRGTGEERGGEWWQSLPLTKWVSTLASNRVLRSIIITSGVLSLIFHLRFRSITSRYLSLKNTYVIFTLTMYSLAYKYLIVEKSRVRYKRTLWNANIVEKAKLAKITFQPLVYAYNSHVMSLATYFTGLQFAWELPMKLVRQEVPAKDEPNRVLLDWFKFPDEAKNADDNDASMPIILLIHGYGGSSYDPFTRRMALLCHYYGWRPVSYHYWRLDWNESDDLEVAINEMSKQFPLAPIVAIGYSAGGHKLLKYLQDCKGDCALSAAIAVSAILNFNDSYDNINSGGENGLYKAMVDTKMQKLVRRHVKYDHLLSEGGRRDIEVALREEGNADRLYDRVLHIITCDKASRDTGSALEGSGPWTFKGSSTAMHYKEYALHHMDDVSFTTLMIHAEDDPLAPSRLINWEAIADNKNIIVSQTKRGGHVGWIEGFTPFDPAWHDKLCVMFISAILQSHAQTNFMMGIVTKGLREKELDDEGRIIPSRMARICSTSDMTSSSFSHSRTSSLDMRIKKGLGSVIQLNKSVSSEILSQFK